MKEFSEECIGAEVGDKNKGHKTRDRKRAAAYKKALLDMLSSLVSIMML